MGYRWAKRGNQPTSVCKQRKRERQTGFGSINCQTGQITVSFADHGNQRTFKKHLKKVLCDYPTAPKIIIVLDNVRYHHAKKLSKWLAATRIELVFLPPYSPDLNPVERVWWYMRKKITHNRYLDSLKERKAAFWRMFSHFLKPNQELKNVCVVNYWS
jgi:transposase